MIKHNFKIGDKVKLKDPKQFSLGKKILTVVDVDCGDMYIPVTYEGMRVYGYFPLQPCEIEKVNIEGQQLLFSFMTPQAYMRCKTTQKED